MSREGNLYVEIWKEHLDEILDAIDNGGGEISISKSKFDGAGNRQDYGFSLEVINANVPIKKGKAQARDLKKVLDECPYFKDAAKNRMIIFNLTKDFKLKITVN